MPPALPSPLSRLIERPAIGCPLLLGLPMLAAVWFIGRDPAVAPGFPLDDAWIHLVYGRALWNEGLFAYNPGVPATGNTAPLWNLFGAAAHALSGSVEGVVYWVWFFGAAFFLACCSLAAMVEAEISGSPKRGWVSGSLMALNVPIACVAFSGMEVTMTAALLLGATWAALKNRPLACGVIGALACVSRPEAAVVSTIAALAVLWQRRGERGAALARTLAALAVPALVVGGLVVGHNLWATGRPLYATFYMKQQSSIGKLPARLLFVLREGFILIPPFTVSACWLATLIPVAARDKRGCLVFAGGAAFLLANLAVKDNTDPQILYYQRYLLPSVPLLVIAAVRGMELVGRRLPEKMAALPTGLFTTLTVAMSLVILGPSSTHLHNDIRNINEVQVAAGRWLGERLPRNSWVLAIDAGAIRYFSDLSVLDIMGLNTPISDETTAAHPLAAMVVFTCFADPEDTGTLRTERVFSTKNYTVARHPGMTEKSVWVSTSTAPEPKPVTVFFWGRPMFFQFAPWPRDGEKRSAENE